MKIHLSFAAIVVIMISMMSPVTARADARGHVLDKLWSQYYDAQNKDLPREQLEILEKIKVQSEKQRLSWDFYDALTEARDVESSLNWKKRDSLYRAVDDAVASYNEPVVTFYHGKNIPDDFVKTNAKALKASCNPEFHKRSWNVNRYYYSQSLLENFKTDYDFVVWALFCRGKESPVEEAFKGRYPLEQFVEFETILKKHGEDKAEALDAFTAKYEDKAVSLMSRQECLTVKFRSLNADGADGKRYEALREECVRYEKDRKASKEKTLASCCTEVKDLLETLDSKTLRFELQDDVLKIYTRNIAKVEVNVKLNKKSVHKASLDNPRNSYYAQDTIIYNMPALDDADYRVYCSGGGQSSDNEWDKYTISLLTKYDSEGFWAYAADYQSGEPVEGFEEGFVKINVKEGEKYSVTDVKDGRKRRSQEVKLWAGDVGPATNEKRLDAILLTDRAAFNPEDTVRYKVILYNRDWNLEPAGAGKKVKVSLLDVQGKEVATQTLTTGEFGSAAGSFSIPRGERNGTYRLEAKVGSRSVATAYITVDDFVLPTFDVIFDGREQVYAGDVLKFSGTIKAYSGHSLAGAQVTYTLSCWGEDIAEGTLEINPDGTFEVSCETSADIYKTYILRIKAVDGTGETNEFSDSAYVRPRSSEQEGPKTYFFEDLSDESRVSIRTVAGDQSVWAIVELYGLDSQRIDSRLVRFDPEAGKPAERTFTYLYEERYPDALTLKVFYFQNAGQYSRSATVRRPDTRYDLPLSFTRFLDTTAPGQGYEFLISTAPGVECAATIFDKSSETVRPNGWQTVRPAQYPVLGPHYRYETGENRIQVWRARGMMMLKSVAATAESANMDYAAMDVEEEAIPFQYAGAAAEEPAVAIREDFSTTIAWEPFLRSDDNGNISFRFKNSDKLSTFYVQLFAHDRAMRNASTRREMVVTLPVKISVLEPRFLYPEDRWNVRVTLSSAVDEEVQGTLTVNGTALRVTVPAHAQASVEVPVEVPERAGEIVLTAVFTVIPDSDRESKMPGQAGYDNVAATAGDGVRVRIPVVESAQTITEAHSAVMLSGADRDALIASLRAQFVNLPGADAELREISIRQMLEEAVPEQFDTQSENIISLARTLYAATLARKLGSKGLDADPEADAVKKLLACRNSDGGFAWIKGFGSSPIVTAVVLDLCAGLRSRSLAIPEGIVAVLPDAIRYLDAQQFDGSDLPFWRGAISMEQYLYVRALYPEMKFTQKTDAKWRKAARNYLVPAKNRGLQGAIFAKARRMLTLQALLSSDEGVKLAGSIGIRLGAKARLRKSLEADTRSLVQYAEPHAGGGIYYPNAVMPWRGLLESELYAHSLICDLLASRGESEIAEGIRLWLMLQKETQQWGGDPGTVNALASVADASPETLDTRVIALSGTVRKPFAEIEAAGNGFTLARAWYKVVDGKRTEITEGDMLTVGDKIVSVCSVWNAENRSFIHISVPRPACLTPKNQLSGHHGWNAFRSVRYDRTEYWFESYPEEKTTVEEAFYVTRSGVFHCAAPEIESLYAPHYRANAGAEGALVAR